MLRRFNYVAGNRLKLLATFTVFQKTSSLADDGFVAGHEGVSGVEDDMLTDARRLPRLGRAERDHDDPHEGAWPGPEAPILFLAQAEGG